MLRITSLFHRSRRRVRPCPHGHADRRSIDATNQTYLCRRQGKLVRDHRRPPTICGARGQLRTSSIAAASRRPRRFGRILRHAPLSLTHRSAVHWPPLLAGRTAARPIRNEMGSALLSSICKAVGLLALVTLLTPANAQSPESVPDTIEGHLAAGKNLAGGRDNTPDFYGLVTAICVAPQRGAPAPDAPTPREDPNRKATYMQPKKAFDDVYWLGTESTSAWLLTSDDGYILYDTAYVYDAEDVLIGGMQKLGLDPAKVKYVIVSHGHRGESGGAYLFQSRYGARIVTADWDLIDGSLYGYPTGKP